MHVHGLRIEEGAREAAVDRVVHLSNHIRDGEPQSPRPRLVHIDAELRHPVHLVQIRTVEPARLGIRHFADLPPIGIDLVQVLTFDEDFHGSTGGGDRRRTLGLEEEDLKLGYPRPCFMFDRLDDVPQRFLTLVRDRQVHDHPRFVDAVDPVTREVLPPPG